MSGWDFSNIGVIMINAIDQERIIKATQTANLLAQNLRAILHSDNPLLADITMDILQQAVQIETKLKRLETIDR